MSENFNPALAAEKTKCFKCDLVPKHWIRLKRDGKEVDVPMCCRHFDEVEGGTLSMCLSDGDVE